MKRSVIALLLLAVGGIGLAVPLLMRGSSKEARPTVVEPRYLCDRCRKQFTITPQEYARQTLDPKIIQKDRMAARRPHCPLCKARHSGWMMVTCPQCGKSYLPPGMMPGASAVAGETDDVCPRCKTDRSQWYRSRGGG